jgi:Flp pilus assembly protein TadD
MQGLGTVLPEERHKAQVSGCKNTANCLAPWTLNLLSFFAANVSAEFSIEYRSGWFQPPEAFVSPVSVKLKFPSRLVLAGCLAVALAAPAVLAQDLHIKLPKRSHPTPVQKLNQDGVKAIQNHDYDKAKKLFYRAYLLDPNDPFTLNNLGYIAEVDGDLDRAQRFYTLAAEQPSEAAIARATNPDAKGKQVADVAGNAIDQQMEINRSNVYAMGLLMKDRAPEADIVLQKALKLDPHNPFTLNNLGFAKEKEGELEEAVKYYSQAAATGSNEPVVVTLHKDWRGKPIREIAEDNAKAVEKVLKHGETPEQRIARLNLRGVSAINRNQRDLARKYFEEAYKIDPNNSFTLNNMGYLAEMDGDRETAQFFYAKAREGAASDAKVALATRRDMEGQRMGAVAAVNDQTVDDAIQRTLEARRREGGPVSLMTRSDRPVAEPAEPLHPTHSASDTVLIPNDNGGAVPANQPGTSTTILQTEPTVIPPLPANEQPQVQPEQNVIPPLPESQQPPNAGGQPSGSQPNSQPQVQPEQKVIPPLPDNQQPNAQPSNPPQAQPQGGVIPPLPDNQQPPNADKGTTPTQQKPPE